MTYVNTLTCTLVASEDKLKVLGVYSYPSDLEVEAFCSPPAFRLSSPVSFKSKVFALCTLNSTFIAIVLSTSGEILIEESGTLDAELVLSTFGHELR